MAGPPRSFTAAALLLAAAAVAEAAARGPFWLYGVPAPPLRGTAAHGLGRGGPEGPFLAEAFSADVLVSHRGIFQESSGTFHYDRAARRNRLTFHMALHMFDSSESVLYDVFSDGGLSPSRNITAGVGKDALCKPFAGIDFVDPYDGIASAAFRGSKVVDGSPCEVWDFHSSRSGDNSSVCLGQDGIPREHNFSVNILLGRQVATFGGFTNVVFRNVRLGTPPPTALAPSAACSLPAAPGPCAGDRLEEINIYRIRSASEPNEIQDRDVGDVLGDMAFSCQPGSTSKSIDGEVVTHWKVLANASWGNYRYCFYLDGTNRCYGGMGKEVGRQSAWGLGVGALQGQCSANEDVGSWYSLPSEGKCQPGAPIGSQGCTWGDARSVRTVSARCVFEERGLSKVCAEEFGTGGFHRSAMILEAALATDDPAQGGCPNAHSGRGPLELLA